MASTLELAREGSDGELLPASMTQGLQARTTAGRVGFFTTVAAIAAAALALVAWAATSPQQSTEKASHDTVKLNSMTAHMSALEDFVAGGNSQPTATESTDGQGQSMNERVATLEEYLAKRKAYLAEHPNSAQTPSHSECMDTCPADLTARRLDDNTAQLESFIAAAKSTPAPGSAQASMADALAGSFDQVHQEDETSDQSTYQGLADYMAPVDGESEEAIAAKAAMKECVNACPSQGFLAQVHWGSCEADCLRQHPIPGFKIPTEKSPLEACIDQNCATHGPLWRLNYAACSADCEQSTEADEKAFQLKWKGPTALDMEEDEREDAKMKVIAVLMKRIYIRSRPADHPIAQLLSLYKEMLQTSLDTVVGTDRGALDMYIRHKSDAAPSGEANYLDDPGNNLEAILDITDAPKAVIAKLSDPDTMKQIDLEVATAVQKNPITRGTADLKPMEVSETTTATVEGNYASQGWNTVCRRNEDDATMDGHGNVKVTYGKSLRSCSLLCEEQGEFCYGFEYRARDERCETWTAPICHTVSSPIESTFVDFRCFKKCTV